MIDIKVIGSGSSGNCYLANINGTKLLLECGLPFKAIQKALGFTMSDILACLLTHEHKDHSKSIHDVMKSGIDCYMSEGTANALELSGHRVKILEKTNNEYDFRHIGEVTVLPFQAVHDAQEPLNFIISTPKEKMMFVTDTAYMKYKIPDVNVLMVECNYVKETLDRNVENGTLDATLRNRIVKNHMSLETLLGALKQANLNKLKKVYVLHLSDGNSDEEKILDAIQRATGAVVEIC